MQNIRCQDFEDVLVVGFVETTLVGDSRAEDIKRELIKALDGVKSGKLLLDFAKVKSASSSIFTKIYLVTEECKKRDIRLKVCNIDDDIMVVLKSLHFNRLLDIYENQNKAFAAFKKKGWFS